MVISINISEKERTYDIERKQKTFHRSVSSNPRSVFRRHRVFVIFFLFSRIRPVVFASDNEFSNERTSTEGWWRGVDRVLSRFAARNAFLPDMRTVRPSNFMGFPVHYFCFRVSTRFTKDTVYVAV